MDIGYKQVVQDYYNDKKNKGLLKNADFFAVVYNPLCGDRVAIHGFFENNRIKTIKFDAAGCILSQAAAAMITEFAQEKSMEEVLKLDNDFMKKKLHIDNIGPTRLRCILLSLEALHQSLKK